jgi:predicted dehydrogenase
MAAADAAGVLVGCAPDTFLGAGHQACRQAIDTGRIGQVVGGAASLLNRGMEHWHPDPTFYFRPGGGPVFDMAPYYLTALINLLGPVRRVVAEMSTAFPKRLVSSEGPMSGKEIEVQVATSVHGVLTLESGATVPLSTSWDVWKHDRRPIEIYGSEGSMLVPDPNFFGGEPVLCKAREDWIALDISPFAFGIPNREMRDGASVADYRIIGLLDMAAGHRAGRPHRASGNLALHVLEVMDALLRSPVEGRHIDIESRAERPAALPEGNGEAIFL